MSEDYAGINITRIIGPVIIGQVACILLYGVLLAVFSRFLTSSAWGRATWPLRTVTVFVVCLATVSTGLGINDIWFYSTLVSTDYALIQAGTTAQCVEPVIAGLAAFAVQILLVLRVAKVVTNRYLRWGFIAFMASASLLALYGAAAMSAWSIAYHFNLDIDYTQELSMGWEDIFQMWLWTSGGIDVLITIVYIIALSKRLNGGTETSKNVFKHIALCAIRCAAYTSILAATAAILAQVYGFYNLDSYTLSYPFWEMLPPLYALSLFTTLGVADDIRHALRDPMLQRVQVTNGSNLDKSFRASGSTGLPQFYVSDVAENRNRIESIERARSARSRRDEESLFGTGSADADLESGLQGGDAIGRSASNLGLGGGGGVMVQVEKVKQVDDEKDGGKRRLSIL
ncbi:hypothetical protein JCM8547_000978 [Rhodosporidiobolus lusitaniae]